MRTVTYRLERLEQLLALAVCPVCSGRPIIIAHREDEPLPPAVGCRCGSRRVVYWQSQSPPGLDEALTPRVTYCGSDHLGIVTRRL